MLEAHVLAMVIIGVSTFVVGSIPMKLSHCNSYQFSISLLMCFGGGVLLATSLNHMLVEVKEHLPSYSELVFSCGLIFMYAIDEIIHFFIGDFYSTSRTSSQRHSVCSHTSMSSGSDGLIKNHSDFQRVKTSYGTLEKFPKRTRLESVSSSFLDREDYLPIGPDDKNENCCKKHEKERSFCRAGWKSPTSNKEADVLRDSSDITESDSLLDADLCHIEIKNRPCRKSNMSLPGLLAALLVHATLEGCSIGVQTNSTQILLVLAAVSSHKLVLAFCLGLEMASAGLTGFRYVLTMATFSIGCPIGILVGVSLISTAQLLFLVSPIQAFAAGTLLYVAVFEVLPRERFKWQHRPKYRYSGLCQIVFVIAGFTLITLMDVFVVIGEH